MKNYCNFNCFDETKSHENSVKLVVPEENKQLKLTIKRAKVCYSSDEFYIAITFFRDGNSLADAFANYGTI